MNASDPKLIDWQADADARHERAMLESRELAWNGLCPEIYRVPLDYTRLLPQHHIKIREIVEWESFPRGLFIGGPTGRGKTRACWQALRRKWETGKTVACATSFYFSQAALKAATDTREGPAAMRRYIEPDILFIDDLGKRMTRSMAQLLFDVLERRTSANKPVVVTTNDTRATLSEVIEDETLAEPIVRRLSEFCDVYGLP